MPVEDMRRAEQATRACDLFWAVGSSLLLHPAAGFSEPAKRSGARPAILNRDPAPLDPIADLVPNAQIGPTPAAAAGAGHLRSTVSVGPP
jgi:NAD-dependent deacetylase